ncbi:MAG: FHA domain-containing protein [Mariprofundaceae bacterium]|nr:FHA domain-containing protein [Mariprofundaceae bacterium]
MSSKLILRFKDAVISEHPIVAEETSIGRKPENTIQIDNLAVSSHHARIIKIGKKIILEDLGSTNGTLVDNKLITKHILKHGNAIFIGKHSLTYISSEGGPIAAKIEPAEEDDMDKTMIISPKDREALLGKAKPTAPTMPLASVQIISGTQAGKIFELTAALTSIGKTDGCRIRAKGLLVGQQAAVITRRPTGYHITHLEGFSKATLNGESITSQPTKLEDCAIIELGDMRLEFLLKSP